MIRQPENIQSYEREEKTLFIGELTILLLIYHFPTMHVYQDKVLVKVLNKARSVLV